MGPIIAHAAARQAHKRGFLDLQTGFSMFRNRSIPGSLKVGSLTLGLLATLLLTAFEIPLEGIVGLLLPFVGPAIDLAIDGAEVVLLPLLFGAAILPHLVRRRAANRI